jgi:hypothetical protein
VADYCQVCLAVTEFRVITKKYRKTEFRSVFKNVPSIALGKLALLLGFRSHEITKIRPQKNNGNVAEANLNMAIIFGDTQKCVQGEAFCVFTGGGEKRVPI